MKKTLLVLFLIVAGIFVFAGVFGSRSGGRPLFLKNGVGVLEIKGMIADSTTTIRQFHELLEDEGIRAVVLRVDTPGGVVAPAQEIYQEVKKAVAEGKKPVVVSMGTVAASGGYYISAPAKIIFANPGTITGSIGVIAQIPDVHLAMDKIGVRMNILKTGPYKDTGAPTRAMTKEDREVLQGLIESSYSQFVKAVAEGRKLPIEQVRKIADGRVYTGEQALQLKLVDRLGNLQDAIAEAAKLAGIQGKPVPVFIRKKKSPLVELLAEETAARIGRVVGGDSGGALRYEMKLP